MCFGLYKNWVCKISTKKFSSIIGVFKFCEISIYFYMQYVEIYNIFMHKKEFSRDTETVTETFFKACFTSFEILACSKV